MPSACSEDHQVRFLFHNLAHARPYRVPFVLTFVTRTASFWKTSEGRLPASITRHRARVFEPPGIGTNLPARRGAHA